jgi:hypothetical protein
VIPLAELDQAWRVSPEGARVDVVREAALELAARLKALPCCVSVRTYDLITFPYPSAFGLGGAALTIFPFVMMTNRMQLVTFCAPDGSRRRLLVNPSDHERNQATPFFARLAARYGKVASGLMTRRRLDVPGALAHAAIPGDAIDYITFDHLHTQDLRRLMLEWCPRARLLVMRAELERFARLHPLERDWYLPDALAGIPEDRIVILDRDVLLGDGVALIRTPGHTLGNHTIVLHTDRGLWTISENGIAADAYTPEKSAIAGLAAHARATGQEVILNSNTREHTLDQYTSMVLEKTLADACADGLGFRQHFPSSELTPSIFAPGLAPSYTHVAVTWGPDPST